MAPRTTEPPLKMVAVRLPQALLDAAQRYADLYHSSVSTLLREGLELRLRARELPNMAEGHGALSPGTVAMLHTLASTLVTAAAEVRAVCQEGTAGEASNSQTPLEGEVYNGHTSLTEAVYDGHTDVMTPQTGEPSLAVMRTAALAAMREEPQPTTQDVPAYDATKYALGKLCPRGHDYHTTGKTLWRLPSYRCQQCDTAQARERRQAKRLTRTAF